MDKDFQKNVSKKFAARWGGIWAGVYNGAGYNHGEDNDDKAFEVAGWVRPFNMIKPLQGFRLGMQVLRGESDELIPGTTDGWDWEINQYMASYQHKLFTVMGQYYDGKGEDHEDEENDRKGYNIAAFLKMRFHPNLRAFGRHDVYDHNDDKDDREEKTTIYGISYDLTKGVMPWAAVEEVDLENCHGKDDYTTYQAGLQVKF